MIFLVFEKYYFSSFYGGFPQIIRIISGKVLQNHNINDGTWENAHLQVCGHLLHVYPLIFVTFPRVLCTSSERLIYMCMEKLFNSFRTFALIIHILAQEETL